MCNFLAHETAGAARTRHSLRPLFSRRGKRICKSSGETRRENGHACFNVIASEAKQSISPLAAPWIASSHQRKIAPQFCRELLAMTAELAEASEN
jgi:hypothetical protein